MRDTQRREAKTENEGGGEAGRETPRRNANRGAQPWGGLSVQNFCFPTCQQVLLILTLSRGKKINMQKDFRNVQGIF